MNCRTPTLKRTLLAQFWAGHFRSDEAFAAFVRENYEAFYSDENEQGDGPLPLSEFAGSQGQSSYDHDFIEVGSVRREPDASAAIAASYSDNWAAEFMRRSKAAAIAPTHFIMVGVDRPGDGPEYRQFREPRSVAQLDFTLTYLGEIEYEDI